MTSGAVWAATDLLLVTEHDSFAHLVDARRFDAAQTLEIGLPGSSAGGEGNGNGAVEDEQGADHQQAGDPAKLATEREALANAKSTKA